MAIIGAAALIAVGIVVAAVLYGRMHGARPVIGITEATSVAVIDTSLPERAAALARREEALAQREAEIEREREGIADGRQELERSLELVSGLSVARAKQLLLKEIEDQAKHDAARRIRQIEDETKRDAERRVRNILSVCMQRLAAGHAAETTVSVVQLSADDMKGRIIGREGRNIRALENLTGIDFIIDDTPGAVVLSGFDPVRREVARVTLERLFADGRIHPARIEEMVGKSRSEIIQRIKEEGEAACQELGIPSVHPELAKLLGTLRFRNSYGHNVLSHSKDTAAIAGMIAAEIGYDEQEAKEIGLFHDIGHAVEQGVEGSHAIIGGEILARLGRPANVVQAVRAHHYDEEPRSVGAFVVMTADAIAATRRGARREALALSVKRLERIEAIASEFEGVEHSFAVQAGKELRVMVRPNEVSDDRAQVLARQIAKRIHAEGSYSGRVKVVVLRETRSVEYAK